MRLGLIGCGQQLRDRPFVVDKRVIEGGHDVTITQAAARRHWRGHTPDSPGQASIHIHGMVFHMKTTLNIDDGVMARLRRESARSGRTMSELVETALRRLLQTRTERATLPPLPTFNSGGALVDIADRESLYRAMEGR